jgi:hypothetical protein
LVGIETSSSHAGQLEAQKRDKLGYDSNDPDVS